MLRNPALTLLVIVASGSCCSAETTLVADPDRAIKGKGWKPAKFAGRDYWQLWSFPNVEVAMPEIKEMAFYQDSGRYFHNPTGIRGAKTPITKHNLTSRVVALREMTIFDSSGTNLAPEAEFTAEAIEAGGHFYELRALNDGDDLTTFVCRGNLSDLTTKYSPAKFVLSCNLEKAAEVSRVVIEHGAYQDVGRIRNITMEVLENDEWRDAAAEIDELSQRKLEIVLDKPIKTGELRFQYDSRPYLLKFNEQYLPDREHIKTHPFWMYCYFRANQGDLFSLTPENFDQESFETFIKDYKETHLGFTIAEWDSNITHLLTRPEMPEYMKTYKTKDEGVKAWEKYFKWQMTLTFDEPIAVNGGLATTQYASAWGVKVNGLQVVGALSGVPVRSAVMAIRGGCRQFGNIPWVQYVNHSCAPWGHPELKFPDDGKPHSQVRRELYTGYYMGANFNQAEGDRVVILCYDKDGKVTLSPCGKIYRELYRWHRNPKGERGESYTPFLFLVDYNHGRTGRRWAGTRGNFKTWSELPFDDGDYMHEHFVRTVDTFVEISPRPHVLMPPWSKNIFNSKIGDICDLFFANPPQHGGAVRQEHLDKYPVVILLGNINYNDKLTDRLKDYVRSGGTLVINAAQCQGALNDPEFLGLEVVAGKKTQEPVRWEQFISERGKEGWRSGIYEIMPVKLQGAKVIKSAPRSKLPLLTKYQYGKGHVLVTTPYFMLLEKRETAGPLIEELLVDLQREVLPIQVRGDVQFMMNKITPDHWKVVLMNNKGILKHGQSPEVHVRRYIANVLLTAPPGVQAEEILNGTKLKITNYSNETLIDFKLDPGQVKIIDIKGVGEHQ